jgi:hypothetical protein
MLEVLTQLLQVQERDQRILKFQKELKDIPLQQGRAKTQLAGDTAGVEKATQAMKEIEVKIKSIELDIQTRQISIKRLQDQQFETRKNDEFTALGTEIRWRLSKRPKRLSRWRRANWPKRRPAWMWS